MPLSLNQCSPGCHLVTHEQREHMAGGSGVLDCQAAKLPGSWIQRRLPKLLRHHLPKALEALDSVRPRREAPNCRLPPCLVIAPNGSPSTASPLACFAAPAGCAAIAAAVAAAAAEAAAVAAAATASKLDFVEGGHGDKDLPFCKQVTAVPAQYNRNAKPITVCQNRQSD